MLQQSTHTILKVSCIFCTTKYRIAGQIPCPTVYTASIELEQHSALGTRPFKPEARTEARLKCECLSQLERMNGFMVGQKFANLALQLVPCGEFPCPSTRSALIFVELLQLCEWLWPKLVKCVFARLQVLLRKFAAKYFFSTIRYLEERI